MVLLSQGRLAKDGDTRIEGGPWDVNGRWILLIRWSLAFSPGPVIIVSDVLRDTYDA